jgi:hypothetical protein
MPRNTIPAYFMLEGYWGNVGGTETTDKPETRILKMICPGLIREKCDLAMFREMALDM